VWVAHIVCETKEGDAIKRRKMIQSQSPREGHIRESLLTLMSTKNEAITKVSREFYLGVR